jgi:hypothetical protein
LLLVLQEAQMTMYANDCTHYTSAPTASELTETRSYSQCQNGQLTVNWSWINVKPKALYFVQSILFDIKHFEEAELIAVILDGQLYWQSCEDGFYNFLHRSTVLVVQALILSHLDYCPVKSSGATKEDLVKLQLAQNKASHLALNCTHRTTNNMLDTLVVEGWGGIEYPSSSLFKKHICVLNA